jgi:hypothetical protein
MPQQQLTRRTSTLGAHQQATAFFDGLSDVAAHGYANPQGGNSETQQAILDSANLINESVTGKSNLPVPIVFAEYFSELSGEDRGFLTGQLLDSVRDYEQQHGQSLPPDLAHTALTILGRQGVKGMSGMLTQGGFTAGSGNYNALLDSATVEGILDDATSMSPTGGSIQVNRAVVAIRQMILTACPFGAYLPADIHSGEAPMIVVSHQAGSKFGYYAEGANLDGINSGNRYFDSRRSHTKTTAGGTGSVTGQITSVQLTSETCETVANGATALKLVKGSTKVYIRGRLVAKVSKDDTGTDQAISGSVTLSGTTYLLSGTISTDTGVFTVSSTGALPNGVDVIVESYIDYNRNPAATIPTLLLATEKYTYLARATRGTVQVNIESLQQIQNEAGVNALVELNRISQLQVGNEKHYNALMYANRLAKANYSVTWKMSTWLDTGAQTRSQNMADISIPLSQISQWMAEATSSVGVTHIYVGKSLLGWFRGLVAGGRFVPSGLRHVPQIYRLGRLDDSIEVYYDPKRTESTEVAGVTSSVLCVGQSQDVSMSGLVFGTAISPIMLPIGNTVDLQQGMGFIEKSFLEPNQYEPATNAFAELLLTEIK